MTAFVLDASALLALFLEEAGAERVRSALAKAAISTVNLSEVTTRLSDLGASVDTVMNRLAELRLEIVSFDREQAVASAELRELTKSAGLSLGDRACLALAQQRQGTALTADRAWAALDVAVEIELIR